MLAMRELANGIGTEMAIFKELAKVPHEQVRNFRNDMYLMSEGLRIMQKSGKPVLATADVAVLKNYKKHIDQATRWWMEAHRGDRGREDWEESPDVRAGRGGGNHGDGDDWRGGRAGVAGQYDACFVVGRGGDDAGEQVRIALEHGAEFGAGVGADAADGDDVVGIFIFCVSEVVLGADRDDCWFGCKRRRNSRFPAQHTAGKLTRRQAAVWNESSGRFGEMVETAQVKKFKVKDRTL
jgi:hypothetical protein